MTCDNEAQLEQEGMQLDVEVLRCEREISALRAQVASMALEGNAWRKAAQITTPGGSELSEPHEVEAYLLRRWMETGEQRKKDMREIRQLHARVAELTRLGDEVMDLLEEQCGGEIEWRTMYTAVKKWNAAAHPGEAKGEPTQSPQSPS